MSQEASGWDLLTEEELNALFGEDKQWTPQEARDHPAQNPNIALSANSNQSSSESRESFSPAQQDEEANPNCASSNSLGEDISNDFACLFGDDDADESRSQEEEVGEQGVGAVSQIPGFETGPSASQEQREETEEGTVRVAGTISRHINAKTECSLIQFPASIH
jgi:hypothetical protein